VSLYLSGKRWAGVDLRGGVEHQPFPGQPAAFDGAQESVVAESVVASVVGGGLELVAVGRLGVQVISWPSAVSQVAVFILGAGYGCRDEMGCHGRCWLSYDFINL
jgi:hypothetical protein